MDTERIEAELNQRKIVIVTGFQGINRNQDITTLGRGGSDTSAVALAAALDAELCQIYTDVDGVYTCLLYTSWHRPSQIAMVSDCLGTPPASMIPCFT